MRREPWETYWTRLKRSSFGWHDFSFRLCLGHSVHLSLTLSRSCPFFCLVFFPLSKSFCIPTFYCLSFHLSTLFSIIVSFTICVHQRFFCFVCVPLPFRLSLPLSLSDSRFPFLPGSLCFLSACASLLFLSRLCVHPSHLFVCISLPLCLCVSLPRVAANLETVHENYSEWPNK